MASQSSSSGSSGAYALKRYMDSNNPPPPEAPPPVDEATRIQNMIAQVKARDESAKAKQDLYNAGRESQMRLDTGYAKMGNDERAQNRADSDSSRAEREKQTEQKLKMYDIAQKDQDSEDRLTIAEKQLEQKKVDDKAKAAEKKKADKFSKYDKKGK